MLLAVVDSTVIIYDYYYSAIVVVVVVSFVFPFLSESPQLELRLKVLCHTAADGHIIKGCWGVFIERGISGGSRQYV